MHDGHYCKYLFEALPDLYNMIINAHTVYMYICVVLSKNIFHVSIYMTLTYLASFCELRRIKTIFLTEIFISSVYYYVINIWYAQILYVLEKLHIKM